MVTVDELSVGVVLGFLPSIVPEFVDIGSEGGYGMGRF